MALFSQVKMALFAYETGQRTGQKLKGGNFSFVPPNSHAKAGAGDTPPPDKLSLGNTELLEPDMRRHTYDTC